MSDEKIIVLDANILLRAVLGQRVRQLIEEYGDRVVLHTPEICVMEARKHIPVLLTARRVDPTEGLILLDDICQVIEVCEEFQYERFSEPALARIARRDPNDWPVLATALLLDCPIWTEDVDFFGCGVATWTTANIEIYLESSEALPII